MSIVPAVSGFSSRTVALRCRAGLAVVAASLFVPGLFVPGLLVTGLLVTGLKNARAEDGTPQPPAIAQQAAMAAFLDRLMLVESGGRDDARNPRSTALGPYQFIESTFLDVARRHLASEMAGLTPAQILALRTNRAIARRAAEAFTRDNASMLAAQGLATSFGNLRLAFLVGPGAAIRLLQAPPQTPVITLLGAIVVQANPFMAGMTAQDLARWAERNVATPAGVHARLAPWPGTKPAQVAGSPPAAPRQPMVTPRCNMALASCRRWLALAQRRVVRVASRPAARRR